MSLAQLHIHNLRNIKSAKLAFHPKLNFIFGDNGSGKTSLLEAIYLLGTGHSFRTREILPMISHGETCLTLFARMLNEQSISIQKAHHVPTQVRLNNLPCQMSSELARFLPCQVFYQDIFQIIDAGPSIRRSVIDWGLFHVKHDYHLLWKNYKRALKQRNSLLRQKATSQHVQPWNKVLSELALQLHQAREAYVAKLIPVFNKVLHQLSDLKCSLHYYKGWDRRETDKSLQQILQESYQSDLQRQFTQYGAHQADLSLIPEEFTAKQYLSRGQQKIVLFALKLAQAELTSKPCVYLCDDLASELDQIHIERLLQLIYKTEGQFFVTAVSQSILPMRKVDGCKAFFLTNGKMV
ncbi:RecF recombinational DNA repair ATPase [Legionella lansingensis]|uniref:DNA replication and repair protein RecF n=1 Tax=Legionella lansingensis TaxID=45067 RepID=A0A0W0VF59_9GAMM|nr:DNA replication/repair protein RecF [Legionella lansingensis]KTD18789.1 RecF recombinational DNA repair ATPase [Legionella lansingensis]SNV43114.1 RecF recombinational DNA repair ATPase [Legionella lansingensis]